MSKHYPHEIDLEVADEGYGGFYDRDMSYYLDQISDEEGTEFKELYQTELDTAARLSWAYNQTLNVPTEVLYDPVFRSWIDEAARNYQAYIVNLEKPK